MMFQDEVIVSFDNLKTLQTFIDEVEETVCFQDVELKDLKVEDIRRESDLSELDFEGMSVYTDTTEHTRLCILYAGGKFYVGSSAIPTLQERCGCAGSYFSVSHRTKMEWYTDTINRAAELTKRSSVLYLESGKVRACWSNGYKYIPISEILASVSDSLTGWSFKSGWWNHDFCVCEFRNGDPDFLAPYRTFFPESKPLEAYMVISTSNTTANGVNINFGLTAGCHIPLNGKNEFSIRHTGNASIEKFRENLTKCFSLFHARAKETFDRMDVPIFYPTGCLKEIMKKVNGIPQNIKAEAIRFFAETKPAGGCTGVDIYFAVCNTIRLAEEMGIPQDKRMVIEEAVARAAAFHFPDFDLPDTE